jgi:hypothetical protein
MRLPRRVSTTRALQMVRKAEQMISENEEGGAPATEPRPSDSNSSPFAAGRNTQELTAARGS